MSATTSFFLGPRLGRWTPGTWDELQQAIASGILDETGWVEMKADLPPNKPGGVETAKDLASLALRSGLLVVGVREASRGVPGQVCGVDLAAARDRIDQIARNVPSPPIYVETREIPDPATPGRGVLLVGVPASGPHMVEDVYWGRGDIGKTPLPDLQVREHLARRRLADSDVLDQVRALERETPRHEKDDPPMPRLFMRVVPEISRRDALLPLLEDSGGQQRVRDLLRELQLQRPGRHEQSALESAHGWRPFARGRYLSNTDPTTKPDQYVTTLRLEYTGAVDLVHAPVGGYSSRGFGDDLPTLHTGSVLDVVHDTLGLVGRVADQYAAYPGPWIIAVRLDAVEGCYDWWIVNRGMTHFPPRYTGQSDYEDAATTTTGELVAEPWSVTSRLLARLVRAVGAESRYLPYEPGSTAPALAGG